MEQQEHQRSIAELWVGDMSNTFDAWIRLLKKGELTVREDKGEPFRIVRVGDTYDCKHFAGFDLHDVIGWMEVRGDVEFLAPEQPEPPYPAQGSPEWMQIQRDALRSHPRAPYWKLYENVIRNAAKDLKPRSGVTKEMVRQSLEQVLAHSDHHTPEPKPLTVDQMREYCIKWCERQIETRVYKVWVGQIGTYFEIREYASAPLLVGIRPWTEKEAVIRCYAIIRAIERGEIGGQND